VLGIVLAVALVLAAAAAVTIIVIGNSSSSGTSTYRQKLSSVLAPVAAANRTMSSALQSLDGSHKTILGAQNATAQAQSAVVAARGAVGVLAPQSSDATLSQQVQQALTEESGYLQAVSSTLSNPTAQSASQLQPLVTSTQSALVPLAAVAPGVADSLSGADTLSGWATRQAKKQTQSSQRKAAQQAVAKANAGNQHTQAAAPQTQAAAPPSSSPTGLTACDQNISVNSSTSCQFADNVFYQYAQDVQQAGGPGSYYVYAFSPASSQTYTDACNYNPANQTVLCSHGSDLIQFPYWAAEVYQLR
jgi:hypothetical protein